MKRHSMPGTCHGAVALAIASATSCALPPASCSSSVLPVRILLHVQKPRSQEFSMTSEPRIRGCSSTVMGRLGVSPAT